MNYAEPPSHEEQLELARRVRDGDQEAFDEMLVRNMRLVVRWAKRYGNCGIDLEDLVQEGSIGLRRAIEKYDVDRGYKFSTYATWWIRQALQRVVGKQSRMIALPEDVVFREREAEQNGEEFQYAPRVLYSLDAPVTSDSETPFVDMIVSDDDDPFDDVMTAMADVGVRKAIARLDPLCREVMQLRFGLTGDRPLSTDHTAKRLGIGPRKVRALEYAGRRCLALDPALADLAAVNE